MPASVVQLVVVIWVARGARAVVAGTGALNLLEGLLQFLLCSCRLKRSPAYAGPGWP